MISEDVLLIEDEQGIADFIPIYLPILMKNYAP